MYAISLLEEDKWGGGKGEEYQICYAAMLSAFILYAYTMLTSFSQMKRKKRKEERRLCLGKEKKVTVFHAYHERRAIT